MSKTMLQTTRSRVGPHSITDSRAAIVIGSSIVMSFHAGAAIWRSGRF